MRQLVNALLVLILAAGVSATGMVAHDGDHHQAHWQVATQWPDRIVVTPGKDPATSFSVNWRTDQSIGIATIQMREASADARFDLEAETFRARASKLDLRTIEGPYKDEVLLNALVPPAHFFNYTFKDLKPDTMYVWRVRGAAGKWSPWRQVRTAAKDGPTQFLFFGDAQQGIRSHSTRVFDAAAKFAPDARLVVHGGDLVDASMYDREWAEWFQAQGSMPVTTLTAPVAGNHDYYKFRKGLKNDANGERPHTNDTPRVLSPVWRKQFTLPKGNGLPADLNGTVYDVRLSDDVHIFVIDSMAPEWDPQVEWLDRSLSASDAKWKVITMHHPLFLLEGRKNQNQMHLHKHWTFLEVTGKHKVDLVLTGHFHGYLRGRLGDNVSRYKTGEEHAIETAFLVTASAITMADFTGVESVASKMVEGKEISLSRPASYTPMFSVIDADGDELSVRSVNALGEVYDAFTLAKNGDGTKQLKDGPEALGETRDGTNSGRMHKWDDVRL